MFCPGNAHPHERFVGRFMDVSPEERRYRYADLPGRAMLRRLDRFFDLLAIDDLQQFLARHHHDPLAPPPPLRPPPPLKPPPPPPPQSPPPLRPPERMLKSRYIARPGCVTRTIKMIKPRML